MSDPRAVFFRFIGWLSIVVFGCDLENVATDDFTEGSRFYPLRPYSYIDYRVTEIDFSAIRGNDTLDYLLREAVVDTFIDVANQLNYQIERFQKDSLNAEWVIDSIWSVRVDRGRIVKEENAVPFIKLLLPEAPRQSWDANAINSAENDIVSLIEFEKPFASGEEEFPVTLRVEQSNFESVVDKNVRFEVYAEEVGLIYKRIEILQYIADTNDPRFNTKFITSGKFIEYRYLTNGDSTLVGVENE